ncbi:hypothetical protein CTAM01_16787 [Colletotrichum tamarilloi]|uniref:Uncharacterized protein n=1 Tax=Colletotrichum tamarilloi TaxID=1209934 RepID=A0ABQ9QHI1_9PEZI|nr:uncharacterized protein CTAM01_16787 [Colletotrichum tamarilloi]KAK1470446.1 hypothetical protein CTAM01_16787 [Colletotrichum tamarilloi]
MSILKTSRDGPMPGIFFCRHPAIALQRFVLRLELSQKCPSGSATVHTRFLQTQTCRVFFTPLCNIHTLCISLRDILLVLRMSG